MNNKLVHESHNETIAACAGFIIIHSLLKKKKYKRKKEKPHVGG